MDKLIFGHQNPDTDTIVSAITWQYLYSKLIPKEQTEAVSLGKINSETEYVLNYFKEKAPRTIDKAASEVKNVMLVDHNEQQQSISDIDQLTVTHVIDHHRIANFETEQPIYYISEPVGCTSTILFQMFHIHHVEIPTKLAGLMLSAIISDTLMLKSPTTTYDDRDAYEKLSKMVDNIQNIEQYGIEMLKAGTDLNNKTDEEIVDGDAKTFEMGDKRIRIGQINTVDVQDVLSRKKQLLDIMVSNSKKDNYDMFLLTITNILENDSVLLVVGDQKDVIEKTFNTKIINDICDLPGVVSRKKQIVPPLTESFK